MNWTTNHRNLQNTHSTPKAAKLRACLLLASGVASSSHASIDRPAAVKITTIAAQLCPLLNFTSCENCRNLSRNQTTTTPVFASFCDEDQTGGRTDGCRSSVQVSAKVPRCFCSRSKSEPARKILPCGTSLCRRSDCSEARRRLSVSTRAAPIGDPCLGSHVLRTHASIVADTTVGTV